MTSPYPKLDVGIFVHNEEASIAATLSDVAKQDIFADGAVDLRLLVVANGCTDATVGIAAQVIAAMPPKIAERFELLDLAESGKSRHVHLFFTEFSRPDADLFACMDGDIALPQRDTLGRMLAALQQRPELEVFVSRPVKDVSYSGETLPFVPWLIAKGADGLDDFRRAISGQLFMIRAPRARRIPLPTGLPVEDGFIRAMVVTDLLTQDEDLSRIDGDPEVFHLYESLRTIGSLLRHQTRIVIGSAINAVIFQHLRRHTRSEAEAFNLLQSAASDPDWLSRILRHNLPRAPFGYVPFSFMTKRLRAPNAWRRAPITIVGFCMDLVVWLQASWHMARRGGAGYW